MTRLPLAAAALAALLAALPARASTLYPETLAAELVVQSERPIPCTLCHETQAGGTGSVSRPFGLAMQARGLRGESRTDLLVSALQRVETEGVDSDADGTPDVDELRAERNPNRAGNGLTDPLFGSDSAASEPSYGCGAAAGGALPAGAAALVLLLLARARRRA